MIDRLEAVWRLIAEVIAEPTVNLTSAVLLAAAATTLLLILVVLATFLLLPSEREEEDQSSDDSTRRTSRRVESDRDDASSDGAAHTAYTSEDPRLPATADSTISTVESAEKTAARKLGVGSWLVVITLLLLAGASAYALTSTEAYCASCHADIEATRSADASATVASASAVHNGVSCVSCHEEALPSGMIANVATRSRHLVGQMLGAQPFADPIDSGACLSCHSTIRSGTLTTSDTGVRISHAEPIDAGMPCDTCHVDMGHVVAGTAGPGMSSCLNCHDGVAASSECSLCHARDVAEASVDRLTFTPVDLAPVSDCSGCHDQESCDACHGIRMPHPKAFVDGEHARDAGFDKKRLCWRCHTQGECGKCHQVMANATGYWGHGAGPEWKNSHGRLTPPGVQAGCGCHGRSPYARAGNYCAACH